MVEYCVFTGKVAYSKSVEHGNVPVSYEIYRQWLDSGKKDIYEVVKGTTTTTTETQRGQGQGAAQPTAQPPQGGTA